MSDYYGTVIVTILPGCLVGCCGLLIIVTIGLIIAALTGHP